MPFSISRLLSNEPQPPPAPSQQQYHNYNTELHNQLYHPAIANVPYQPNFNLMHFEYLAQLNRQRQIQYYPSVHYHQFNPTSAYLSAFRPKPAFARNARNSSAGGCTRKNKDKQKVSYKKPQKPYACSLCKLSFSRAEYLRNHTQVHQRYLKEFKCEICGETFSDKRSILYHIELRDNNPEVSCIHCCRMFTCERILNLHKAKCKKSPESVLDLREQENSNLIPESNGKSNSNKREQEIFDTNLLCKSDDDV